MKHRIMTEILGITITEWIGYLASFFVGISFFMRNIITLRYVNSIGCFFFIVYGFLLDSWPVIITNFVIVCVNFYYLFINKKKPAEA